MVAVFKRLVCIFLSERELRSSLSIPRALVLGPDMDTTIHGDPSPSRGIAQDPSGRLPKARGLGYEKLGCLASVGLQGLWNIHNKAL